MSTIQSHQGLKVYQKSLEFVTKIYQLVKSFPEDEKYGLSSQIKRAAVSIPLNIAEGSARQSTKELLRFSYISLGSITEVETLLEIGKRLELFQQEDSFFQDTLHIKRMLMKWIQSLKKKV